MTDKIQGDIPQDPDALMTTDQAAQFLSYSALTLNKWRIVGGGPAFVKKGGRCVRYRKRDLIEWSEDRLVTSTSAA